jgi:acyl dehydratase
MTLNLDIVGSVAEPVERTWTSRDTLLYALGVGAGSLASDYELSFTTENSADLPQEVLPTMAAVLGTGGQNRSLIGDFDPAMLLHGEQGVELFGPIPPEGTVRTTTTVAGIYDKGSGALVVTESTSVSLATGRPLFATTNALFIRGEGGFGGQRGPTGGPPPIPDRRPDRVVTYATRPDQALLYRLSGDHNPLHSDPVFAGGQDSTVPSCMVCVPMA